MKDERNNGVPEDFAERVARIMSDLLSRQFGAKITIILEDKKDEDDVNQDEPIEVKK